MNKMKEFLIQLGPDRKINDESRMRANFGVRARTAKMLNCSVLLTLAAIFSTGCTIKHDYVWAEYPVKPERVENVADYQAESSVEITNGNPQTAQILLAGIGAHKYYGSLGQLTEAVVVQFSQELEKRGMKTQAGAPKSISLEITSNTYERGMWVIRADLNMNIKLGNGTSKSMFVSNTTGGTVPRMYNGAVSVAVTQLLNDPEISDYLRN